MKRVCAWCLAELGVTGSDDEQSVTHTICVDCADNLEFQRGVNLQDFIDSLKIPVVMVGVDGRVLSSNPPGCAMLGKALSAIVGRLGGEVFECAYARLPEGCGQTMHCSGCTIRRMVSETYRTGKSIDHMPAVLQQGDPRDPVTAHLFISTRLCDGMVMLVVEGGV